MFQQHTRLYPPKWLDCSKIHRKSYFQEKRLKKASNCENNSLNVMLLSTMLFRQVKLTQISILHFCHGLCCRFYVGRLIPILKTIVKLLFYYIFHFCFFSKLNKGVFYVNTDKKKWQIDRQRNKERKKQTDRQRSHLKWYIAGMLGVEQKYKQIQRQEEPTT